LDVQGWPRTWPRRAPCSSVEFNFFSINLFFLQKNRAGRCRGQHQLGSINFFFGNMLLLTEGAPLPVLVGLFFLLTRSISRSLLTLWRDAFCAQNAPLLLMAP
jgi:hypothetical protein